MHNSDDELPEDEEEILVYVEFDGSVASSSLSNEKLQLDMIGLDMEHPIMQVNGKFYEGTYRNAVGTYLFFEGDRNPRADDPVFDATPTLKYVAKTRKVLTMNRIFVELKTELLGDSNNPECVPSTEVIEEAGIPPKYREGALKSWEKMRDDRMKALNDYLEKQRVRDEKRSRGIEPDSASDDDNPFAVYKPKTKTANAEKPENRANISLQENTLLTRNEESTGAEVDKRIVGSETKVFPAVDPEPSTSKIGEPWNDPGVENQGESFSNSESNEDNFDVNLSNFKGMHKARVRATKRAKIRKYGNPGRKKSKKTTQSSTRASSAEASDSMERDGNENSLKIVETDGDTRKEERMEISEDNEETTNEEATKTLESMESLSISQATEGLAKITDDDLTEDRKVPEATLDRRKLEKQQRRAEKMRHLANQLKRAADERRQKNQRFEDAV